MIAQQFWLKFALIVIRFIHSWYTIKYLEYPDLEVQFKTWTEDIEDFQKILHDYAKKLKEAKDNESNSEK